jgi:hypothetical protein
VHLWLPATSPRIGINWRGQYGLETPFAATWLPADRSLKRYDFAWLAINAARRWKADLVYTWTLQAAVLALWSGFPVIYELHDRVTGRVGPWLFRQLIKARGQKRILIITEALRERVAAQFNFQFQPEQVRIAPNGADLSAYAGLPEPEAARAELGLPQGFTAAYTGHFYPPRHKSAVQAGPRPAAGELPVDRRTPQRRDRLDAASATGRRGQRHPDRLYRPVAPATLPGRRRRTADALRKPHRRQQRR